MRMTRLANGVHLLWSMYALQRLRESTFRSRDADQCVRQNIPHDAARPSAQLLASSPITARRMLVANTSLYYRVEHERIEPSTIARCLVEGTRM